jgi:hypothetical protein
MKKIKATTALKACYFFIAANALAAACCYLNKDSAHTIMMLSGSMMWIVCALIWGKTVKDEEPHGE